MELHVEIMYPQTHFGVQLNSDWQTKSSSWHHNAANFSVPRRSRDVCLISPRFWIDFGTHFGDLITKTTKWCHNWYEFQIMLDAFWVQKWNPDSSTWRQNASRFPTQRAPKRYKTLSATSPRFCTDSRSILGSFLVSVWLYSIIFWHNFWYNFGPFSYHRRGFWYPLECRSKSPTQFPRVGEKT